MTEKHFISDSYPFTLNQGNVQWRSPSNIALVKYWGKKEHQIPANPSISFTLDACATTTTLSFEKLETPADDFQVEVLLDGDVKTSFKPKILQFFQRIERYVPFLKAYQFTINTHNSFPHSSGIASSASGMSALALCLMDMESQMTQTSETDFKQKASFLARLGSGSASRSIEGDLVAWGTHQDIAGSSDLFGVKFPYAVHPVFQRFHDTILLVDKGEKQVSSTVGHGLMLGHPYAEQRFQQAHDNLQALIKIFSEGDLERFIEVVESEALTLHAMMMTSLPYFILMKPNTLAIINKIWEFRRATGLHICFTLDAGANVHVLYPEHEATEVYEFIKNELVVYCQNQHYICDRIGFGAKKL